MLRKVWKGFSYEFENECIWKGESDVGTDAVACGKFHAYPAFHATALDYDDILGKGRGKRCANGTGQFIGEVFQSVAGEKFEG